MAKCLHTSHGDTGMNYAVGGIVPGKTGKKIYLRITTNANMNVSEQCRISGSMVTRFLE